MAYLVSEERLIDIVKYRNSSNSLCWPSPFVLPVWMETWWHAFGENCRQMVLVVREDEEVIGIAPFKVRDGDASFIGDNSVCDYLDFIVAPGKEEAFSKALLHNITLHGIRSLVLETLRPESVAMRDFAVEARNLGLSIDCSQIDVSYEMELPGTYEEYLASLGSKQRRDIERKTRRLGNLVEVRYSVLSGDGIGDTEIEPFLNMMADSRRDKASFLTERMRAYFRELILMLSHSGLIKMAFLYAGNVMAAGILYFTYNNRIFLYNSGYEPRFADFSVGLVSKLYCIRQSILDGMNTFDFLKGSEIYKSRLGGREIKLFRCVVDLE